MPPEGWSRREGGEKPGRRRGRRHYLEALLGLEFVKRRRKNRCERHLFDIFLQYDLTNPQDSRHNLQDGPPKGPKSPQDGVQDFSFGFSSLQDGF